jgi:Flp pilus assembly protein TadD
MNKHVHKLTASGLVMSLAVIGCTPTGHAVRPASLSAQAAPEADGDAGKLYAQAQAKVQAGNTDEALTLAERVVELAPRDIGYRMLLGDLYLKAGRFASAEAAFNDVTALEPGNVRGSLSLALTMIAQGKKMMAIAQLEQLDGNAPAGDLGLAFALAGEHVRAVSLLESAASAAGATGRVRQNLALAYALSGDWQKARTVAAQDVSSADLPARMESWANLANPNNAHMQVPTLLGVTPAAQDPGQPVRLALAAPAPVDFAEAVPVAAPVQAPIEAVLKPVQEAPAVPVAVAKVETPIVSPAPAVIKPIDSAKLAAAVEALVEPRPAPIKAVAAALPAFKPARVVQFDTRPVRQASGRFVVQIGAYRHVIQAERAWGQAQRRYGLGAKQALSTTVSLPGRGTFHRLSVAGFASPDQATRLCGTIRARGGACFVRTIAGDQPLQYAMRNARRG